MAGKPFRDFPELSQETKDILASQGFERATPVQEATIPLFAGNKDVAVDACTGSGKTLAFVVPIIEKLRKLEHPLKRHQVRELCQNFEKFTTPTTATKFQFVFSPTKSILLSAILPTPCLLQFFI